MGQLKGLSELLEALKACKRCQVVDKPFLAYYVYELWLPGEVRLLLIAESPPPGQKEDFFYNLNRPDRLRRNLRAILGLPPGEDVSLLAWLKEHGIFLTSAVKCRPPAGARSYRDERALKRMALNCAPLLAREIEVLRPGHVMALGKVAELAAGALGLELYAAFPHPNYVVRFRRDLMPALREAILEAVRLKGP